MLPFYPDHFNQVSASQLIFCSHNQKKLVSRAPAACFEIALCTHGLFIHSLVIYWRKEKKKKKLTKIQTQT